MVSGQDHEKTALEPSDFAGLEVDRRSPRERGDINERLPSLPAKATYNGIRYAEMNAMKTPEGAAPIVRYDHSPDAEKCPIEYPDSLEESPTRGKKRPMNLRIVIGISIFLMAVIVGAIVGGVLGSRSSKDNSHESSSPTPDAVTPTPTASPEQINSQLPSTDIMVDAPLAALAFDADSSAPNVKPGRNIQVFYQTNSGGTQQVKKNGISDWSRMTDPIFTDAANNSGYAAISYMNNSQHQSSIFYASEIETIREKRLYPSDPNGETWEVAGISYQRVSLSGNTSIGKADIESPANGWGGFRLAAAYSANFSTGAGARLFYHTENETDRWIEEKIWHQENDTWSDGTKIYGALPGSHLSAVFESSSQALRLFYATPDNTLSESWLNISDSSAAYQKGISISNILMNPSADITTASTSAGTFLYYASMVSTDSNITIRELKLPKPTISNDDSASLSSLVTTCDLMAKDTGGKLPSLYVPIGAAAAPATSDQKETITVFWPEDVEDQQSGYGALKAFTRPIDGSWKDGQVESLPIAGGGSVKRQSPYVKNGLRSL